MVVDEVARRLGVEQWRTKDKARQAMVTQRNVVFVEPQSFMNASGIPVRLIASWYRTPPESVLVISDDMDLPFGKLRMRPSGGHGGHNGLRSIIATMGENFPRLRMGIGRSEHESIDSDQDGSMPPRAGGATAVAHVLSPFSAEEKAALPKIISAASDAVETWLDGGLEPAMQSINTWMLV